MKFNEYLEKSLKGEIIPPEIKFPWGDYTSPAHLSYMKYEHDMVKKGYEAHKNGGSNKLRGRGAIYQSRKNAYWYGWKLAEKGFPKP